MFDLQYKCLFYIYIYTDINNLNPQQIVVDGRLNLYFHINAFCMNIQYKNTMFDLKLK